MCTSLLLRGLCVFFFFHLFVGAGASVPLPMFNLNRLNGCVAHLFLARNLSFNFNAFRRLFDCIYFVSHKVIALHLAVISFVVARDY